MSYHDKNEIEKRHSDNTLFGHLKAAHLSFIRLWDEHEKKVEPGKVKSGKAVNCCCCCCCFWGASVTWGHVKKYASLLYTEDVYLTLETPGRDVVYGSQNASDSYIITALHVEDLSRSPPSANGVDGAEESAHLQVSVYGLEL
ncbi:uncharacterized protein LOC117192938 [Drosophila miranda]|uniref:uncharacterized protein LOC117192938 n=1 Tax=Drosophila miranda TaxID=7229 RepID=UPI00143F6482|nr:uncharacterized protein LOC117192938 [Drosophila miranda]